MFAKSALKAMLGKAIPEIDPELLPTDRIMQRWAVGAQSDRAHPLAWDDRPSSRPSPLSDDDHVEVERIILNSRKRQQRFIRVWYLDYSPIPVKCEELGLSERAINIEWFATLWDLRIKFITLKLVANRAD